MLGAALCARGGPKQRFDTVPGVRLNDRNGRCTERECARLVKEDGIELPERFQVDSTLNDRAGAGGASDRPENGNRRTGSNSACSRHDYDRDGWT